MASRDFHTALRVLTALVLCIGIATAARRCKTTPEQEDLSRFVAGELALWLRLDREVQAQLARLDDKTLKPAEARALLSGDVMPRLAKLRLAVAALRPATRDVEELRTAYLHVIDRVAEACRVCLRAIDDPKIDPMVALKTVRAEFAAIDRAYRTWDARLQGVLLEHHLIAPVAPSSPR